MKSFDFSLESLRRRRQINCILGKLECNLVDVVFDAGVRFVASVFALLHLVSKYLDIAFNFDLELHYAFGIFTNRFNLSLELLIQILGGCERLLHLDVHVDDSLHKLVVVFVDDISDGLLLFVNIGLHPVDILVWLVHHFLVESVVKTVESSHLLDYVLDLVAQGRCDVLAGFGLASLSNLVVLHLLLQRLYFLGEFVVFLLLVSVVAFDLMACRIQGRFEVVEVTVERGLNLVDVVVQVAVLVVHSVFELV